MEYSVPDLHDHLQKDNRILTLWDFRHSQTETGYSNRTIEEDDMIMFTRLWRNMRKARKQRNWEEAFDILDMLKNLKRFLQNSQ